MIRTLKKLALGAACCVPFISSAEITNKPMPNIILILADDMGYGDVNCYFPENKDIVATPYIDKIAANGMRFTDAHAGAAVCSPSRFGILTGRNYSREPFQEKIGAMKGKTEENQTFINISMG